MYKKIFFLITTMALFCTLSCSKEEVKTNPIIADFDIEVIGEAPSAQIKITNNSTNSSGYTNKYDWSVSQGATITNSLAMTPTITADKTGEITITLLVYDNKGNQNTIVKKATIGGANGLYDFKKVGIHSTYYSMFFAKNGSQIYGWRHNNAGFNTTLSDITLNPNYSDPNALVPYVIFGVKLGAPNQLMSPDDAWSKIPNGKKTKIKNNVASTELSVEDFDAMTTDIKLKSLTIESDNIGYSDPYPKIILFETYEGTKGAVKVNLIGGEYTYDIKMVKY